MNISILIYLKSIKSYAIHLHGGLNQNEVGDFMLSSQASHSVGL